MLKRLQVPDERSVARRRDARRERRVLSRALLAHGLLLLSLSASRAWAAPADADSRTTARSLAYAGVEAYAVQNYREANEKLEAAFRLLPVPSLGLWSARTLRKLGKLVQAEERYRAVSSMQVSPADPAVQRSAKLDAASDLEALLPRIPHVTIALSGALPGEVEVRIDGIAPADPTLGQAFPVDPGRHSIVGTRGSERVEVVVDIAEGGHEDAWLKFASPVAKTPHSSTREFAPKGADSTRSTLRTGAWVTLTAAGAGLTTSVAAYWLARQQFTSTDQRDRCAPGECSPAAVDAYDTWRRLYLVSLISGGILGAAGVSLLLISEAQADRGEPRSVSLQVGPAAAALVGTF